MWKKLREKQRNRQECTTAAAVVRILGGKFLEVHINANEGVEHTIKILKECE